MALEFDLIDVDVVLVAYCGLTLDPSNPDQKVVFGTPGHRSFSLDTTFNDLHIAATTQVIVKYRAVQGAYGPLFISRDTHALSLPAWRTAAEVLVANGAPVFAGREDEHTLIPTVSRAIIRYSCEHSEQVADGIVVTSPYNPSCDGGFKYSPPTDDPAGTDAAKWVVDHANIPMASPTGICHKPYEQTVDEMTRFDCRTPYCTELAIALDLDAIAAADIRIRADPLDGASAQYWEYLARHNPLDPAVVDPEMDPTWGSMTLDTDGKIRIDYSSSNPTASLVANHDRCDIATSSDADLDRHGIVTPSPGLMNPNAFLTVMINCLFFYRPGWVATMGVGKTLVSSPIIGKVAAWFGRKLVEASTGFKWFIPGLIDGSFGSGGEESVDASFLDFEGRIWTAGRGGVLPALFVSEILAVTGRSPSQYYIDMELVLGTFYHAHVGAEANHERKVQFAALPPDDVGAHRLVGQPITMVLTNVLGNGVSTRGIKVTTDSGWFAVRPSGAENRYKVCAESLRDTDHLVQIQAETRGVVDAALQG